jgi:endonuclease IV
LKLSLGVSVGISRFLSVDKMTIFDKIIHEGLNAVEIGLLNCSIGVTRNIPGTAPYPTEKQINSIKEILSPKKFHLSIHGPYRISATSMDEKTLKFSKSNLSATLKVANWLEARHVTFHGGSFKKKHNNDHVRRVLMEWEEWRQEKGYNAKLAPEVGGKYNSFSDFFTLVGVVASIDNCLITWDISHDFARGGKVTTEEGILKRLELLDQSFQLNEESRLPIHFSGMVVGKAGERYHTLLDHGTGVPWQLIFSILKEQDFLRKISLICESKVPKGDKILKGNAITDALRLRDFLESDQIVKTYKGKPGHLDYYFSN